MTLGHVSAPHTNSKSRASGRFVRILAVGLGGILLFAGLACGAWWFARYRSERARTHWKSEALERLAGLSINNDTVRSELDELRMPKTKDSDLGWAHEHVLLMTNGESIIYEYRHGANIYFPPTLVSWARFGWALALQQLSFLQFDEHGAVGRPARINRGVRQEIFSARV